jgi:4-amino-4-deoxy-L-arabinose transferase-like glycosyltransferase
MLDPAPKPIEPLRRRIGEVIGIGLLALMLNLIGNGRVSLWDRDEPRYATCAREMIASGDWIHPTFNAQPRYDKPVLIYWLMMAGMAIGGDNPFGARLVSAVAGAGTCLVVWGLGRRMLGARVGRLAALILATTPLMVVESKLATTDATLTLWLVGGQACLWELSQRPSRAAAAGFWVLLALAVLTKGPIGLAWVATAGLVSWWWRGPTECWKRLRWRWGLSGFWLLTAPWFIAVGLISHGAFFRRAVGYHVLERISRGIEEHGAFFSYYLVTTVVTFHPWSALLPAAIWGAWTRRRTHPAFGFLLGWVVGPWILLECVQTKMVHYYLPALPAAAMLVAWLVEAVASDVANLRRWPLGRLALGLLGGVGLGVMVVAIAAGVVVPSPSRWACLALAVPIGVGTILAIERFQRGATRRAAAVLIATWGLVLALAYGWLLPSLEPYRFSRLVGERLGVLAAKLDATPMLASFQEPSLIYTLGQPALIYQNKNNLVARVRRNGPVLMALFPGEVRLLKLEHRLELVKLETLKGFNLSKGQQQHVQFTLVRPAPLHLARRGQKSRVK